MYVKKKIVFDYRKLERAKSTHIDGSTIFIVYNEKAYQGHDEKVPFLRKACAILN